MPGLASLPLTSDTQRWQASGGASASVRDRVPDRAERWDEAPSRKRSLVEGGKEEVDEDAAVAVDVAMDVEAAATAARTIERRAQTGGILYCKTCLHDDDERQQHKKNTSGWKKYSIAF